jgi:flagellar hook-associated protein 2
VSSVSSSTPSSTTTADSVTVLTFTGQSKYASSFQQILTKAVQTDSVQLAGLQDRQSLDQNQLQTLESIDQTFSGLQTATIALSASIGPGALQGSVANTSLASVSVSSGATAGSYQLEVDDLGAATQAISAAGSTTITDPLSQDLDGSSSYTISVADPSVNGGQSQDVTVIPTSQTLSGLVQAINATRGIGVSASIVNVGSQSAPDYRLALQAINLGATTISLTDSGSSTNLTTTTSTGRNSSYSVDGQSISGTSDTVALAPGVSANLLEASTGNPTTITVSQSTANAQGALQNFATAYNAAVDALATQHGASAGSLSGDSILLTANQVLSQINGFSSNGQTLSTIGLDLNTQGHLTFNSAEFSTGAGSNFAALSQFFGDTTTGFIGAATSGLATLEDPTSGAFPTAENTLSTDLTKLSSGITDQINQINAFQQNLYQQLSASDAAIYTLTSQADFFTQLFQTENANLNGGA